MNEAERQIMSVLGEAVEYSSPEERAAFLDKACAGDIDRRARVEELLRAYQAAGNFLQGNRPPSELVATLDEQPISECPGTLIGPYKLLEQIGEGGFGIVYMAEQQEPVRRKVALKVLKPGMDTRQVVARFEAERQALALMDHPNIAHVFDGGETESGRPYFVMELVKGTPITRYCDEQRLTPQQRLELFVPVCEAVQHAHHKGIIHRDLKPSNVLVAPYDGKPVVKVIDFGVAKATGQPLTERTLFTGFGAVVGTLEYMSPEEAELNNQDIDTRSDLYSLGVLLYELLTGTTPLGQKRAREAGLLEALRTIREEETLRPSARLGTLEELPRIAASRGLEPRELSGLIRGELDWIVMKALDKDRSRRYETASAFAADVQRYLHDESVLACPPSAAYRFGKFARRNRGALATGTLVAGVLFLGTVVSVWLAARAIEAEGLAANRLDTETQARQTAVVERDKARRRLFDARLAQARATRLSRQPGQRLDSLAALREAVQLARDLDLGADLLRELRDEAIACFALADVRLVQSEWPGFPPGSSGSPAFDADLQRYARVDEKDTFSVRRVADDRELARPPNPGTVRRAAGLAFQLAFSPDGALLAWADWGHQDPRSSTNFQLWDWRRGKVVFQPSFPVASVAFSPDGRHLALAQFDGTITLHDSASGKELRRWGTGLRPSWLAFHPDGGQLAVCSVHSPRVRIYDPSTGKLLGELKAGAGLAGVAWHPEGALLAAGGVDAKVYVWDAAAGRTHAVLHGHDRAVYPPAFAAGGAVLLSTSDDGTTRLWDPWAGEALLRLSGRVHAVSRDGRRFVTQTGTHLGHWELVCSREYRALPRCKSSDRQDWVQDSSFSPDGRWLLASGDRGVWLWDMAAERPGVLLPLQRTIDAQFHPRRDELFTSGDAGLFRWQTGTSDGVLRIGPAAHCLVDGPVQRISMDPEGRRLTVVALGPRGGGRVFDLEKPGGPVLTLPHVNANSTATSPNGQWIATGTAHGYGVKLWAALTGKEHLHLIPNERNATVTFSPNSRWLVTRTPSGVDAWDVVTGHRIQEIRREPRRGSPEASFSPDGKLLAVTLDLSKVELINTATWQPVARLLGPDASLVTMGRSAFSPDGSLLVVSTTAGTFRVWDLRRVRARLRDLDLDWPWPAYRPPPYAGAKPMRVEADVSRFQRRLQAHKHMKPAYDQFRAGHWQKARDGYATAVKCDPDCAIAANNLAWLLATCPQEDLRDAPRAVALAQRAVRLEPHNANYWNTLGVAHYRAGDWPSARSALEKSLGRQGGHSLDWFFLAMTHWQLGDQDRARRCHEQAIQWMAKHRPHNDELRRFKAEAESLLLAKAKKN
jgi:serine/threonine protein kinase/WD40 repeat protein/Tfp pilus assembly protein PilF